MYWKLELKGIVVLLNCFINFVNFTKINGYNFRRIGVGYKNK